MNRKIGSFLPCLVTLCEDLNKDVVGHIFMYIVTLYHCGELQIDIDDEEVWWTGPCSIGVINNHHPRIYLRPPYTTTFITDEEIDDLATREQFFEDLEAGEYPADCGHFKYDKLPFLIKILEEGTEEGNYEYKVYTSLEWRDREEYDDSVVCTEIDEAYTLSDHLIVLSLHPTQKGWIIHDKERVLGELRLAMDKCIARNIAWLH